MKNREHARLCAALTLALALAGCSQQRSAEAAVRNNLKDPDSARFGDFYYNSKTRHACLTTNAKNTMGGYTGNQQFKLQRGDQGWEIVSAEEIGFDECRDEWADKAEGAAQ